MTTPTIHGDWSAPALRHMTTAPRIRHCERMLRTATSVRERETYRAELRRLRGESESQPRATITVPAGMVDPLRDGVYLSLDAAIQSLARAKFPPGHKADPERYELLEATQALLDRAGRVPTVPPASVSVDLDEHRLILLDALHRKLDDETRVLNGSDSHERVAITERLDRLAEFIASAEAQGAARPSAAEPAALAY
jgi:hypothetical protein